MAIFNFDPHLYAPAFAEQGYVHIERGLSEEFFAVLSAQVNESLQAGFLDGFALGDKQQALCQFPQEKSSCSAILETVGAICGIDSRDLVISERHIKAYELDANPQPPAHKDRFASQIAVGLPISVSRDSSLVLYPYDDVGDNPFNSWAELRASLSPDRHPESILRTARRVEIKDSPRDVLVFRGSAVWHLRSNPAGTITLYIKLNSYNCDPLGEDPLTPEYLKQVRDPYSLTDLELDEITPLISRRVDFIQKRYDRNWAEVPAVAIRGDSPLIIDEQEFEALKAMDGHHTVRAVISEAGLGSGTDSDGGLAKIRRLAERGIIDLLWRSL